MTQVSPKTIDFVQRTTAPTAPPSAPPELEETFIPTVKAKESDGEVTPFSPNLPLHYPLMAFLLDAIAIAGAFLVLGLNITLSISSIGSVAAPHINFVLGGITVVWLAIFFLTSLYKTEEASNYQWIELRKVAKSLFIAYVMSMGFLYLLGWQIPQSILFQHLLLAVSFTLGWRSLYHTFAYFDFIGNNKLTRRVLVISSQERAPSVMAMLRQVQPEYVDVVGVVSNGKEVPYAENLGDFNENLRTLVTQHKVDDVVMAFTHGDNAIARKILKRVHALPVHAYVLPDYMDVKFSTKVVNRLDDLNLVNITTPNLSKVNLLLKRALDIVVSLIALAFAAPVMAFVALAIKMESDGPILFMQERMGADKKKFSIFKFRSMRVGADDELDDVTIVDAKTGRTLSHKHRNDPRVTRIGKFIRKTSLDELPQIFNVLRGDMSLVGPRPEILRLVGEYEPWQDQRFLVKQGITGWWQVNGRSENACHLSTHQDVEYINNFSFLLDIQIILMTVPALLKGKGAF